jgi:hypothetical protein
LLRCGWIRPPFSFLSLVSLIPITHLPPQQPTPPQIPNQPTKQPFDHDCASTGEPAISVTLEFTTSGHQSGSRGSPTLMGGASVRYTYPLPLPVSVLHFVSGLEMDRATFLRQWEGITVPEVRDTFAVQQPQSSSSSSQQGQGEPPGARYARPDALVALLTRAFRLQLVRELCQKNDQMQVLTLAGSVETGTLSPQGKQVRIGVLVRLEQSLAAPGGSKAALPAYRLTVRAVHPGCALAAFRAIKHQLLA